MKTSVPIQDVDRESIKYIKNDRDDPSWAAQKGQLIIPVSNLNLKSGMRSPGMSMCIYVRRVGVGLTHTKKFLIKKLKLAGETGYLEAKLGKDPKEPDIERVKESFLTYQMNTQVA